MKDVKDILGASVIRVLKRPVWLAAKALTGARLQSSTHFSDVGFFGGIFEADANEVEKRMPAGLHAREHRVGHTEVTILALDYRKSDILAGYREVAIRVPVQYAPRREEARDGWWVLQMPVTTEEARWGGVDNYGFPKFVADIEIEQRGNVHVCRLAHGARPVLELTAEATPTEATKLRNCYFTGRDDGVIIESHADLEGELGEADDVGGATLTLGYHEIADQLRAIGIADTGRVIYCPQTETELSIGTVIGKLEARAAPPVSASGIRAA